MNSKIIYFILFLLLGFLVQGQETLNYDDEVIVQRSFDSPLKDKYAGEDFTYIEPTPQKTKEAPKDITPPDVSWLASFMNGAGKIILGIIILAIVVLIVKYIIDKEGDFSFRRSPDKKIETLDLISEENIEEFDLEQLLSKALNENDYRLATRFHYLLILKKLSELKLIKLDKNKTNSDYLFEIKNENSRDQFSKISYIYNHVWYGEFSLSPNQFDQVATIFQQFKPQH